MQYDRTIIGRQAKELGFVRDTFEKVCVGLSNICYSEDMKEERTSEGDLQPKGRMGKLL